MIKANELRINNFVLDRGGKILQIEYWEAPGKVAQNMVLEGMTVHPLTEKCDYIEPIPLTEEWLLKFGFLPNQDRTLDILVNNYLLLQYDLEYKTFELITRGLRLYLNKSAEYVHTLQNLYFALTGEELTLTDKNKEE